MNQPNLHVGDTVDVDLPGYKHHGKRGTILRLKRYEGVEFADVSLYGERRCKEFLAVHLKRVEIIHGEIPGLPNF